MRIGIEEEDRQVVEDDVGELQPDGLTPGPRTGRFRDVSATVPPPGHRGDPIQALIQKLQAITLSHEDEAEECGGRSH